MKNIKKLIAVIMVIALMIPCTAMAATESVSTTTLTAENTVVTLKKSSYTYKKGTTRNPGVTSVVYTDADGNAVTLVKNQDYTVTKESGEKAGTYTVTVTGIGKYAGSVSAQYTIKKATQSKIKVTTTYKAKKASAFAKKAKTYKITIKNKLGKGKVTYTSSSKKIKVSSNGTIKIKKGIKKGTYTIKVKVKATANYKAYTKTIKIKVK